MQVTHNPDTVTVHNHELVEILAEAIKARTGRDMDGIQFVDVTPFYVLNTKHHERADITVTLKPRSEA